MMQMLDVGKLESNLNSSAAVQVLNHLWQKQAFANHWKQQQKEKVEFALFEEGTRLAYKRDTKTPSTVARQNKQLHRMQTISYISSLRPLTSFKRLILITTDKSFN